MVADDDDRAFGVEEQAISGCDGEGDTRGEAHDESEGASGRPLRKAVKGEEAESERGEKAVDSADEEGGVGGETASGERNDIWWAREEVGESEQHAGDCEIDGCYERRVVDECVHFAIVRLGV